MANEKISQLPAASTSSGSDLYPLVQSGSNFSITFTALKAALNAGVSTLNSLSGPLNILAGTNITVVPSGSGITINSTGGSGANTTLSNLTSPTAINQDIIPSGSRTMGSSSSPWVALWINEILAPGQIDFNLTTGVLTNNSGSGVVNFTNNAMTDNAGQNSLNWQNRLLFASNGSTSVDWANRALGDGVIGPQLSWTSAGIGLPQLTLNTVPYINASNVLTSSSVTPTELGYMSGVTSSVQTQINSIAAPAVAYTAGDPTKWAGSPPTTVQQALDRLAAVVGAVTPIP